ncbi:MAG: SDR family oxidoreductase [Bacillota bacterium]|nr:SDR family oxidoreductase [Bacillota bacterium]
MKLKGKVALVTGASRGLGKQISLSLAEEGSFVIVNYLRDRDSAKNVVTQIKELGGRACEIQGDITEEARIGTLIRKSEEMAGAPIQIIVNNATGPQPELSLEDVTWEDYENQLNYFVKAPLLILKEMLPSLKITGGSIINIGSEVVHIGNAHFSNYVTAKSAMLGMTRSWASELGKYGIRVNLVNPGFIPVERHTDLSSHIIDQYKAQLPLQRMGVPVDLANMVVFLASDDSSFITGQSLTVNGGNTFGI